MNRYDSLYNRSHSLPQADTLIEQAQKHNLIPLYVLYNYIKYSSAQIPGNPWEIGCRVAHANQVRAEITSLSTDRCTFESMLSITAPWNEILNLQATNTSDSNLVQSMATAIDSVLLDGNQQITIEHFVPDYVMDIQKHGFTKHPLSVDVKTVVIVELK